jgi:hypothetical protein
MLTATERKTQAEKLRNIVMADSKIKYDPIDRHWEVEYEDGEFDVKDCYRFTANRGFMLIATIKTEI